MVGGLNAVESILIYWLKMIRAYLDDWAENPLGFVGVVGQYNQQDYRIIGWVRPIFINTQEEL